MRGREKSKNTRVERKIGKRNVEKRYREQSREKEEK